MANSFSRPLAAYVHWPYCRSLCPYCHFNRYLEEECAWQRWAKAFQRDIAYWGQRLGPRHLTSIFFGGGTPSLMHPPLVHHIIEDLKKTFPPAYSSKEIEITLEINPSDHEKISPFIEAGINRFSMGIQSFDQETLSFLGRNHTIDDIKKALSHLQKKAARYSFDLIYGHKFHLQPDQWAKELSLAAPFIDDHLSLYQLTYEKGTPFYTLRHQELEDEVVLTLEDMTAKAFLPLNLKLYEISNYAKPHGESLHNLAYWEYREFLGLGPGAHGRVLDTRGERWATHQQNLPQVWLEHRENQTHALARDQKLNPRACIEEQILMGLRLTKGIPLKALGGLPEAKNVPLHKDFFRRLDHMEKGGFLEIGDFLKLTPQGRRVLNSVVEFLCRNPLIAEESKDISE